MNNEEIYLRAILATVARQTFSPQVLFELITVGAGGLKQIKAYNLCDGTKSQSEIANAAALDKGSFSRTLSRWIDAGIVIRVGEGREARLVHIYPLPNSLIGKAE